MRIPIEFMPSRLFPALCVLLSISAGSFLSPAYADRAVEARLKSATPRSLVAKVQLTGDPKRGAWLFHRSAASCIACHSVSDTPSPLGPNLAELGPDTTAEQIAESILYPSKSIKAPFETVTLLTLDGQVKTGIITASDDEHVELREVSNLNEPVRIAQSSIEATKKADQSIMPEGLATAFASEQDFYDLVSFVLEVAHGGKGRAAELMPAKTELDVDDTKDLDHAGILSSLGAEDLARGKAIFESHCVNCHGRDGNQPTLPTARAFGRDTLRFGADPYSMFMTVSRGAGLMASLGHLSPRERYQVVHYVREALMKDRNLEYAEVTEDYLASLPKGTRTGDVEQALEPRDFGPVLASQLGSQVNSGLTFRLPGEVTVCYDLHRMQIAAAWQGGFLDLSQTHHYRQRGERMPQIDGTPIPGLDVWTWAHEGRFEIPTDAKPPRGPLRGDWLQYKGHYLHEDRAIMSYTLHGREILETVDAHTSGERVALGHTLEIGPGTTPLELCVGQVKDPGPIRGVLIDELGILEDFGPTADRRIAVLSGKPRQVRAERANANQAWAIVTENQASELDLGIPGRTIVARFRTTAGGTLIASAPDRGIWKPNGKTLFVRGGRLVFDIGWVGAIQSRTAVNDGEWHTAALVVTEDETRLVLDGKLEATREEFRRPYEDGFVTKVGATATNFGGDFVGDIAWIQIIDSEIEASSLSNFDSAVEPATRNLLWSWKPEPNDQDRNPVEPPQRPKYALDFAIVASVLDSSQACRWRTDNEGRLILSIPANDKGMKLRIIRSAIKGEEQLKDFQQSCDAWFSKLPSDLSALTHGGAKRWDEPMVVSGELGADINGYALDSIPVPFENPWNAWVRTSALDFYENGDCVVTTHGGDVYLVEGIDEDLKHVTWTRLVAGLFEPFGVRIVDDVIYVTCRDGVKKLHDFNGDKEIDFVEAFWVDDDVSSSFHAYNFDLQTDQAGNFYFAKAGQYTQHHRPGTIMRIPPEGGTAEVIAWGLRTPNGMGVLPGDRFTVSDNQGPWMPAGKISLIRRDRFYGNMPINDAQDAWLKSRHGGELPEDFEQPIVWTPQELDNSCGGQTWVSDERFGPLADHLMHSSFGKGWLYPMSLQEIDGVTQAAIYALPHQWEAGVMRLRVNPADGQLYGTGLSGWQGPSGGADGCLQRLRYTGKQSRLIDQAVITPTGIQLRFTFPLDNDTCIEPESYQAEMWNYLWSRRYGSDQFSVRNSETKGHDSLEITRVERVDAQTMLLVIPGMSACDQLQLDMLFNDANGQPFTQTVYMTIHKIPDGGSE